MTPKPSKKGSAKGTDSPGGGAEVPPPPPVDPPPPPVDSPPPVPPAVPPPTPGPMGVDYEQLILGMIAMAPMHIQPYIEYVLKDARKARNVDSEALRKAQIAFTQCINYEAADLMVNNESDKDVHAAGFTALITNRHYY